MRFPLALRIVLLQILFVLGAALAATWMVRGSFREYEESYKKAFPAAPGEQVFQSLVSEVAHSLLYRIDQEPYPEAREVIQRKVAEGFRTVIRAIPSIKGVVIADAAGRIQFASEKEVLDLTYVDPDERAFLASDLTVRRAQPGSDGSVTEVMVPVFERLAGDGQAGSPRGRRLGSVIVRYTHDEGLLGRQPRFEPRPIDKEKLVWPLVLLAGGIVVAGFAVAAITALPVRRLDRALQEFRARGFRGHLSEAGLGGELASTVAAINEMGGRLQRLDDRDREREALLATLSQSLEDGMLALDSSGRPTAWSEAAVRLLGPEGGEEGIPEAREDQERLVLEGLERNPVLAEPGTALEVRETDLRAPDGRRRPVQLTRMPLVERPGRKGTLVLLRDVATLRAVENHLLESGRYAVLVHLAAGLAHEIRNPLHSIGLNAGVVQEYVKSEPSQPRMHAMADSLSTIQEETRRLTDLLNNYLGLVRPSSQPEPVNVRVLCRRVARLLDYAAQRSKVEIVLEGEDDVPEVQGAPDRLQQAILNLVLNAIQAMPEGGKVRLGTSTDAGMVQVTVSDTGPGLPREIEENLFEVRVTTKHGGSGLGLPLVKMIAEAHGGSVRYRSSPGSGAAFMLILPARTSVENGVRS